VLLDEGSVAWFEPETEEDKALLIKAVAEHWSDQRVLSESDSISRA
jgi:hypothetical protein